jgi:hypothetical protein
MLQWIRTRARLVAAATLVSLVALGGVSSVSHGGDCHDDECAIDLRQHDPSSHGIQSGSGDSSSHPIHCILCHWTRTLRPSNASALHLTRPLTDTVRLYTEVLGTLSLVQAAQPPLRSPPDTAPAA